MKRSNLDILVCPVCHSRLELKAGEESEGEIRTGTLRCPECAVDYPIEDGIPNMLPPEHGHPSGQ